MYRSADRGATWTPVDTELPEVSYYPGHFVSIMHVVVDPRNADVVFALGEDGKVYKTTNGGGQWKVLDQGIGSLAVQSLTLDQAHRYTLYGVVASRIYTLPDGSDTWQLAQQILPIRQDQSGPSGASIAIDPAEINHIVASNGDGLYITLELREMVALPMIVR